MWLSKIRSPLRGCELFQRGTPLRLHDYLKVKMYGMLQSEISLLFRIQKELDALKRETVRFEKLREQAETAAKLAMDIERAHSADLRGDLRDDRSNSDQYL